MKIADIQIDGFGIWSGLTVEKMSGKATVFFGRNEAGKTTLMQFVRSVLYGFSHDRRARYLPPVHGGRSGGQLRLVGPRGAIAVRRHTDASDDASDSLGEVELIAADGTVLGQHQLNTLLAGVDEAIFNNVFAVGLRELQELAALDNTEAAQQLYKLTSGLDRVSLVDVMRELEISRERILARDDRPSQIVQLLSQHETLQRQLDDAKSRSRRWVHLSSQRATSETEIARIEHQIEHLDQQAKVVEIALQTRDLWLQHGTLNDRILALGAAGDLSHRALKAIDLLGGKIEKRQARLDDIKRQRRQIRTEAAQQPINRPLWAQAARIEAIGEHAQWIQLLESQTQQLQGEVTSLHDELTELYRRTGLSDEAALEDLPDISQQVLSKLRPAARAARHEKQQLVEARLNLQSSRQEEQRCAAQLETELAQRGKRDLATALSDADGRATKLRQRLELEQRGDELHRRRRELLDRCCELLERQVVPLWLLGSLGGLFVLGVVLLLTGLIGGTFLSISASLGWALALLGAGGTAAAVTAKVAIERSAIRQLEACNRQGELLELQIQQTEQQRQHLDAQIPPGGGQLDSRLDAAQAELQSLQELLPLDQKRQAAARRAEAADGQIRQAASAVNEARSGWRAALQSVGLPPSLSPKHLRELAHHCRQISHIRQRLDGRSLELQQRQTELSSLAERIDRLLEDAQLDADGEDTEGKLQQLSAALAQQQQLFDRRNTLRRQDRRLRRQQRRYQSNIEELHGRRRSLFAEAGINNEGDLRQLLEKIEQFQTLTGQRDELTRRIDAAIGGRCSQEDVARLATDHCNDELDKLWEQLISQGDDAQQRMTAQHQQQGRLDQEMKTLADDRRLAEAQLEIGSVEQRLKNAIRRWQVLAVTSSLLDSIRRMYETERQPETLREASTYLNQLTDGAYTRIWTPLGERVLRVDGADGQSLSLEVLSRGTREALFLSLRLALVSHYARAGSVLPLVLDDVLVNFDTQRAKAAARVLRDFAKQGNQLLLFTCHEHIMKIFKAARVEVRMLPDHSEVVQTIQETKKTRRRAAKSTDEQFEKSEQAEDTVEEEEQELVAQQQQDESWEEDDDEQESEVDQDEEEEEDELDDEEYEEEEDDEELDQEDMAA